MSKDFIHFFGTTGNKDIFFKKIRQVGGLYFSVDDKLEVCKNENVDIMIDDDWRIIKNLADNNIKTLYFRDTNLVKLEENKYIKEVNNWGDIYRIIKKLN